MTHSVLVCTNRMCPKWPKVYFDSRYVCVCVCVSCVCWIKWKMDKNSWQFAIWNYRIAFLEFVHFTKRQRWQFCFFFQILSILDLRFFALFRLTIAYNLLLSFHRVMSCLSKKKERKDCVCLFCRIVNTIHPSKENLSLFFCK